MSEIEFVGQREGEEVEIVFRRHILTAIKGFFFSAMMILLFLIPMLSWKEQKDLFWFWLAGLILGLVMAVYTYILWYFSIYVVTNQRIRQIQQKGLFKKTVVDLSLDKIQSIAYNVPGFLAGIFNYGTILVQTGVGDLRISLVSNPEEIYNQLQNLVGKEK